jgi:phosphate transport system permease protein
MASSPQSFATTGRSRKGEPWVWLTAAGLAVGVTLTVALLLLVLVKGTSSFWPRELVKIESTRSGEAPVTTAGFIVQERERRDSTGVRHEEIQVFRGNRELNGDTFVFIDRAGIGSISRPTDLWLIERLEGGNVIARPEALVFHDGRRIEAAAADFREQLDRQMELGEELRDELRRVEKVEIGKINKALESLRIREKVDGLSPAIDGERAGLQARYEELAAKAREIREELERDQWVVAAADGRTMELPTGELLHVFEPNTTGFFGRLGEMIRRAWNFLTEDPREANTQGGVFPAIFGTVVMTLVMSVFVTPFGVMAAIYLREYAKQGALTRAVRISVNNLAGVPSIVFGVFGLAFFVYFVGGEIDKWFFSEKLPSSTFKTGGILWASLTLALLTVPVVVVATEEALAAVPRGVREAALASGASKWQMIQRVVLPASLPGILTGVILAMARGAGEVAPLMLVGVVKLQEELPLDTVFPFIHAERKFMHLGFHIYDLGFQSPDSEAAKPMVFATTLLLISLVVVMNLSAILLRNRLRKRYATSSF